jgi:hypothetical protein
MPGGLCREENVGAGAVYQYRVLYKSIRARIDFGRLRCHLRRQVAANLSKSRQSTGHVRESERIFQFRSRLREFKRRSRLPFRLRWPEMRLPGNQPHIRNQPQTPAQ